MINFGKTETFYLPLKRGSTTPPEITVVIRRTAKDRWQGGLAICSKNDNFVKKYGRALAFNRIHSGKFVADSPKELIRKISDEIFFTRNSGEGTEGVPSKQVLHDLLTLEVPINKMEIEWIER